MAKLAKPKANNGKSKQKGKSKDSDDQNSISDYEESENSEEDEDVDDDDDEEEEEKKNGDEKDTKKETTQKATTKKESNFTSDCKKLFGKTNLYEILEVQKDCQLIEIKKAYHKLSLKVHPDKVKDEHKEEAKSKFQILGKVYSVLSDAEKRKVYDETGTIDDHDFASSTTDWNSYFRALFKRISEEDIGEFFKNYKDSPTEKADLLKLYEQHKGDMDLIVEQMYCDSILEDEERFRKIIKDAIEKKEIEAYDHFTNETDKKKQNRKNKYEKEAKEAEELKKELGLGDDLKKAIAQKSESRKKNADAFFKNLEEKYSKPTRGKPQPKRAKKDESENEDDDEEEEEHFSDEDESFEEEEEDDDDEDYGKSKRKSKTTPKKATPVKRKATPKRGKKYDDDDDEEEAKPKKQSTRSKKQVSYKDEDSEEEEEDDDDDDDDDSFDMEDDDDEDYGKSKKKKSPVKGKPIQSKNTRAKKVKRL